MTNINTMTDYFNAERAESMLFIAVAAIALVVSAWSVIVLRTPFFSGMAVTLTIVALLQGVVGVTVYRRSPQDIVRVGQAIASSPARVQAEEVPRMQRVMRNFRIYLGVEVALLIISLAVYGLAAPAGFLRGAACGLAIQAVITIVLDLFATRRGSHYLAWLQSAG